jgi:hypothetical protein
MLEEPQSGVLTAKPYLEAIQLCSVYWLSDPQPLPWSLLARARPVRSYQVHTRRAHSAGIFIHLPEQWFRAWITIHGQDGGPMLHSGCPREI